MATQPCVGAVDALAMIPMKLILSVHDLSLERNGEGLHALDMVC